VDSVLILLKYAGLLIGGLSILIIVHELGHFLPAKWFGMRVEKFYLFFDWPRKLWSIRIKDTEYGIGILPLGGYVKISGIIDESMDTEHLNREPQPWEFRAKPVWQRIIVMIGGVTMNVLLAILIYSGLIYSHGEKRTPMTALRYGIDVPKGSLAEEMGFETSDQILLFNGKPVRYLEEINTPKIFLESKTEFTVLRGGDTVTITVQANFLDRLYGEEKEMLFLPDWEPVVLVLKGSPAEKAGMKDGDRILQIDSFPVTTFGTIRKVLQKTKAPEIQLVVERNGNILSFVARLDSSRKLGIYPDYHNLPQETVQYTLLQSVGKGTAMAFGILTLNLKGFAKIVSGEADFSRNLAGPVRISKMIYEQVNMAGWYGFWNIVAALSMILAFMNLLPIPALDGGHLLFLVVEWIIGREVSPQVRMIAQQIGMILLLLLFVYIIFNDIIHF
jgi:regulator of sigma E protease